MTLKAPFPWFGGKSRVASVVWERFGPVPNYVEPFAGSLAVLLGRPDEPRIETVNDADGFIANVWRAIQADPDEVARWASWPVNEADLHARHVWLLERRTDITDRLCGDPEFHDVKVAGWWLWGICSWIGAGWCAGSGPWRSVNGRLAKTAEAGAWRQLPHLGDAGQGINRQLPGANRKLPHLGDAGQGINRQLPGANRKRPHLGDAGRGVWFDGQCEQWADHMRDVMNALRDRLRRVRICCGDWTRVLGPSPTLKLGEPCGVFLDPPYDLAERDGDLYVHDDHGLADDVRTWAIAHGDDPRYRIALCGYGLAMPDGWELVRWKAKGGYGSQGDGRGRDNAKREEVWFSPYCLRPGRAQQAVLFEEAT